MKDFHLISIWYHGSMKLQTRTPLKTDFRLRLHSFSNQDLFYISLSKGERGGNEISLFHRLNHCIPHARSTPSYLSNRGL